MEEFICRLLVKVVGPQDLRVIPTKKRKPFGIIGKKKGELALLYDLVTLRGPVPRKGPQGFTSATRRKGFSMTDEQKAAYVMAQSVCALGDILGMHAENQVRVFDGESPAFGHKEMSGVCEQYGIHHNAIIGFLTEGP